MNSQTTVQEADQGTLWQMIIDEAVDREMQDIVQRAFDLMQKLAPGLPKDFGRKQLHNLIATATETNSMEIVKDFVRYQMGRDEGRKHWRKLQEQSTLGEAVLDEIDQLKERASFLIREAKLRKVTPANEKTEINRVWALLVRRFVAYLEHSFTYVQA